MEQYTIINIRLIMLILRVYSIFQINLTLYNAHNQTLHINDYSEIHDPEYQFDISFLKNKARSYGFISSHWWQSGKNIKTNLTWHAT